MKNIWLFLVKTWFGFPYTKLGKWIWFSKKEREWLRWAKHDPKWRALVRDTVDRVFKELPFEPKEIHKRGGKSKKEVK